jgi:serine/threonine protein kinase
MSSIDTDELANSEMNPELTNSGQSLNGGRKKIGQYEVIRLLGRGAFGTVKLALDPTTQTYVSFLPILVSYRMNRVLCSSMPDVCISYGNGVAKI